MLGVVVNPNANGLRRDGRLADRLRAILGNHGALRVTHTASELESAIDHFAHLGCDLIATCGGDGTNLATITQLATRLGEEHLPRLAILRGGTVNTVASNLGIHGSSEDLLQRLVERLRRGEPLPDVRQDVLVVNGNYGFLFAAAMGARFIEAYYGGPMQGVAWATALAARTVASALVQGTFARWLFEPIPVELWADGVRQPVERVRLLLASTVPDVGIGMKVTWQAGRVPRQLHLIASSLSTTTMALQLRRVLAGEPLRGTPHLDRLAGEVEIRFAVPQTYTLDGDLFRDARINIRCGPPIRILRP